MTTMVKSLTAREAALGAAREEARERTGAGKNLLLFFAAPWIGLAYIVALPFVGTAVLVKAVVTRRG